MSIVSQLRKDRRSFVFCLQIILFTAALLPGLFTPVFSNYVAGFSPVESLVAAVPTTVVLYYVCLGIAALALVVRNFRSHQDGEDLTPRMAIFEVLYHLSILFVVATRTMQVPLVGDDAFIDYRYARHWLDGQYDFNPGEKVMGFTAHLHIFTLYILGRIFPCFALEHISVVFNCLLQCLSVGLIVRLLRLWVGNPLLAVLGALIFSLSSFEMVASAIGKEQPLGVVLLLVALIAFIRKKVILFAWSSVAIALVRPEGALFCALAFLFAHKLGKGSWKAFILPGALFIAYHLFLFSYFGSPFPHAALVKSMIYTKRALSWATFAELVRHIGISHIGGVKFNDNYSVLPGILYLAPMGFFVIFVSLFSRLRKNLSFFLYTLSMLAVLAFYAIPNSWIFNWYLLWFALMPVFFPVLLFSAWQNAGKFRAFLACAVLLATIIGQVSLYPLQPLYLYQPEWGRFAIYREAGLLIKSLARPGDEVAVTEPGLIAYYYGGPVLDLGGLISDKVVSCYARDRRVELKDILYAPPPEAISKFSPRFICFNGGLVTKEFTDSAYFQANYHLIKFWPISIYRSKGTYLYERN